MTALRRTRRGPGPAPVAPSAADAASRRHARRRGLVLLAVAASLVLLVLGQAGLLPYGMVAESLGGVERAVTGSSGGDLRRVTAERDALALRDVEASTTGRAAADLEAARRLDVLRGATLVPARVVAWSRGTGATDRRVTIDIGTEDGVTTGAAVTSAAGLVGRVGTVHRWTSDVVLLGDGDVTVAARVGAEGALAAVSTGRLGRPDASPRLTVTAMVPGSIRPGDAVVTAGSPPYPAGLRIGTVGALDPASGQVAASAELRPSVDVATVTVVTVVVVPARSVPRPALPSATSTPGRGRR